MKLAVFAKIFESMFKDSRYDGVVTWEFATKG